MTAIDTYLAAVRGIRATQANTTERSFYPAFAALVDDIGSGLRPRMRAVADPSGRSGNFPDLAILERSSQVMALPVEVKGPEVPGSALLRLDQARRYAETFGGGMVLLTNLHQVILAGLTDGGEVEELDRISLVAADDLDAVNPELLATDGDLEALINRGTEPRATLRRPVDVADHLARHAIAMVDEIQSAGDVKELLAPVWELFESGLGTELDEEFFVPSVVQTLVYGLFASWLTGDDPGSEFEWQSAAYRVEVPLFADVLHATLRPHLVRRCNLIGHLESVAGVLRRVDRVLFDQALGDGAIEYFYEPFLARFDETLRNQLGVWYTPREIAEYQVARCDHHLRTDLGIADGLADHRVVILDPAVGTGTYLAAVYRAIHQIHLDNGEPESVASDRLKQAALTRVIGFEILPGAFIVAHLALARALTGLDVALGDDDRVRVYLTNSLTGWDPARNAPPMVLFPDLEAELEAARHAKQQEPVMVILGNPPYEGYSRADTDEEKELIAPWVAPLWSNWGLRKHRLNDLYARFWKAAINRVATTGQGVVSFISNRQWLAGRSYPEMRADVLRSFDHLVVDDLHGDVHDRTHAGDESVFTTAIAPGIRVGTAVVTATRVTDSTDLATVRIRDLRGPAEDKRTRLGALGDDLDRGLTDVETSVGEKWRLTNEPGTLYPYLDEYFALDANGLSYFSGVQPVRDEAVLAWDRETLEQRMRDYFDTDRPWVDLVSAHPGFGVTRSRYDGPATRAKLLSSSTFRSDRIVRYLHRPMDARWLYWEPDHKLLNEARRDMIPFWTGITGQIALVAPQTRRRAGAARPLVATQVPAFASVDPDGRVFPLLRPAAETGRTAGELGYDDADRPRSVTAIAPEWIAAARRCGATGNDDELGERIFSALAGVAASGAWLVTQGLRSSDLPGIPIPADPTVLASAAAIGRRYAALIDPDRQVAGVTSGTIRPDLQGIAVPDAVSAAVTLVHGNNGIGGRRVGDDLYWDDTGAWRNIPAAVWEYQLGGFAPLTKVLSYRVGSVLTATDRHHVMHLARRLQALHDLQAEADGVFEAAHADPLDA